MKQTILTEVTPIVAAYLLHVPEARDDDRLLVSLVWGSNFTTKSYTKGMYHNHDTITRARRKLQQHNAWLRGKKWKERHKISTTVKEQMTWNF